MPGRLCHAAAAGFCIRRSGNAALFGQIRRGNAAGIRDQPKPSREIGGGRILVNWRLAGALTAIGDRARPDVIAAHCRASSAIAKSRPLFGEESAPIRGLAPFSSQGQHAMTDPAFSPAARPCVASLALGFIAAVSWPLLVAARRPALSPRTTTRWSPRSTASRSARATSPSPKRRPAQTPADVAGSQAGLSRSPM